MCFAVVILCTCICTLYDSVRVCTSLYSVRVPRNLLDASFTCMHQLIPLSFSPSVRLESFSDSDDDSDPSERGLGVSGYPFDDFRPLSRYSRYGNDSLRSNHRGSGPGGSRRRSGKGRTGAAREVKISTCSITCVRVIIQCANEIIYTCTCK